MTKSKAINSKNQSTESDPERIVGDWVDAVNSFNQWNSKLVNVIDAHILMSEDVINPLSRVGNQRAMADLVQLRLSLVDVLNKLLVDVNRIDAENNTLLKVEILCRQTRTIHQWNEKIRQALELNSCGIA